MKPVIRLDIAKATTHYLPQGPPTAGAVAGWIIALAVIAGAILLGLIIYGLKKVFKRAMTFSVKIHKASFGLILNS